MRAHAMRSGARGFTLVEAIAAVAIAAALVGALGVFVSNLLEARGRLLRLAERIECADAAFDALARASSSAVVSDRAFGPGVLGSAGGVAIVRSSVGIGADGTPLLGERLRVEVRHDPERRRLIVRRGASEEVLGTEVAAARFRYLGEGGWTDSFDSLESGRFPVGIEVALWFATSDAIDADGPPASPPDRLRLFRIPGAPTVDPLALRSIREDGGGS